MKIKLIATLFLSASVVISSAQQEITLEDIWTKGTFAAKGVAGFNSMNDGKHYTAQDDFGNILKYTFAEGKVVDTVLNSQAINLSRPTYKFNQTESKLLLETNATQIYRHSYVANIFVYDVKTKKLTQPVTDMVMLADFSPDGNKIGYVKNNNLFYFDLQKNTEFQITNDGISNQIINGATDWVYEEEFALSKGFYWNENGSQLAYYRFNETHVKEFNMAMYGKLYPDEYKYKYPKAGESNSEIEIYVYDVTTTQKKQISLGTEKDIYIPRICWTKQPNTLFIQRLNRLQNKLEILSTNSLSGQSTTIYTEENTAYVDVPEINFLSDGKSFIINSEKSGWNHLYHYSTNGNLIKQITQGNWDVDQFYGIDNKGKTLYISTSEINSTERYVYAISIDGKTKKQITHKKGWNTATFNTNFSYFLLSYSNINTPPYFALCNANGSEIRMLEDNKSLSEKMANYNLATIEIGNINNEYNEALNQFTLKPKNFDAQKKYPVLMYVYGGPGHQLAVNRWMGANYFWYQLLAKKGYIIVCTDGRGTGFKGEKFKKSTYLTLGKYEIEDQIFVAKQLQKQPYIDANRIGIWGWSFGGYMASLGITKGASVFKTAIAVAPVTNWRYYDNIYTERFMRTPQENGKSYDENSPINYVDKIKGNYLIIHGTADDNVHFQNAVEMVNAMINKGVKYDSEFYPNKNHGIGGGKTRLHLYERMTRFILEKL